MGHSEAPTEPQKNSNLLDLARGVIVNIGGKIFGRGLFTLNQIFLARILGPENFGLYGIGWIFFRIASIISTLGLDSGVIHHTSKYWGKDKRKYSEIVITAFLASILTGSLIGLFIYIQSDWIAEIFRKPALSSVLRIFSLAIPAMAGLTIISSGTRVSKDMKKANLIEEIILPCFTALLIGIIFLIDGKLEGFVLGTSLAVGFTLIMSLLIARSDMLTLQIRWKNVFNHLGALINYSLPITLPILFGTLITILDRILTGYFLPEFDTGIYQSVSMISALFVAILSAFKTMAAPMMAENYHTHNPRELKAVMLASSRWVFIICAPFFLIIFTAPREFIQIVFGDSYLSGVQALVVLAFAQVINIAKGPIDQLLIMTGNQKKWLWITLLALLINLLSNVLLIPEYGILGAAFAQAFAYSILAAGGIILARNHLGIFSYDRDWLKIAGITLVTGILLYFIRLISPYDDFLNLVLICLATGIIYLSLIFKFGITESEMVTLRAMIPVYPRKEKR